MSEMRELYQQVILDHNKNPRNFKKIDGAERQAEGYNPLCGDEIQVYLELDGDVIKDISFQGKGCAISTASGSMMTSQLKGKTLSEALNYFEKFHDMVTGEPNTPAPKEIGKLKIFSGVCEYPARVKCASLAWHTLKAAIEKSKDSVSTE